MALAALGLAGAALAAESPTPAVTEVGMPGKVFVPGELDVLVGGTVRWQNTDTSTHTVTADEDAFDSGHLRPGQSFARAFQQPGVFAYHCTIHRFMRGVVRVFAVVLRGPARPLLAGKGAQLEGVAPPGATQVVLERVSRDGAVEVGRMAPGEGGTFAFAVPAAEPIWYRARAGEATSPVVPVPVSPRVSVTPSGGALTVETRPLRAGAPVVLQAYDRERFGWVTVRRARLDGASKARLPYPPGRPLHLRAVVGAGAGWSEGLSRVVVVRGR